MQHPSKLVMLSNESYEAISTDALTEKLQKNFGNFLKTLKTIIPVTTLPSTHVDKLVLA